jgi:triosephosphate isomerase
MKYIFANWKMYLGFKESIALAKAIAAMPKQKGVDVALFPSALVMTDVIAICRKKNIPVGAQNCAWMSAGAYTGAISARMFRDVGCRYALVGHSERRHIFGETDTAVRNKLEACLSVGLTPVLCIGETKEERDAGKRAYRLKKQLMTALDGLEFAGRVLIAYEPVWAIGMGDACAPADADDVHHFIRQELRRYMDAAIPILYGGSVDEKNAASYLAFSTVDGLLIGGASAKKQDFVGIIAAAKTV